MKVHRDAAKIGHAKKLASYGGSSKGIGSSFEAAEPVSSEQRESKPDKEPGVASIRMAKSGGVVKRLDKSPRTGRFTGGRVHKADGGAWEGSKKDLEEDKKLAKKAGMSLKEWEKSAADEEHDEGEKMGKGGRAHKANGGGTWEGSEKDTAEDKKLAKQRGMSLKEWEKSAADKKHDREERASGGRVGKGKTTVNIVLNGNPSGPPPVAPPMPMPMMGAPRPPMPPAPPPGPPPIGPAAGGPPIPPMGGPAVVNPLQRAKGGRVNKDVEVKKPGRTSEGYLKMDYGSGGGKGRRQKIEGQA